MKERIGALDRIMNEVSHDIKLPKMAKTANGFDEELQKGIKVEMEVMVLMEQLEHLRWEYYEKDRKVTR